MEVELHKQERGAAEQIRIIVVIYKFYVVFILFSISNLLLDYQFWFNRFSFSQIRVEFWSLVLKLQTIGLRFEFSVQIFIPLFYFGLFCEVEAQFPYGQL